MAIAEIIKFEGPKEALVWKNPGKEYEILGNEKFNTLSQLIVDEFYEAILFINGNALDLFKPGRYTLNTQNIPLLTQFYEKMTDGNPFPCKVYFINKTNQLELKWGTKGGITLNDPIYDIFLHVGCCGTMAIRITDSRRFLLKFVGNQDTFSNDNLLANLRGIVSSHVKNLISKLMIQGKVSFFDMNAHIYDVGLLVQKVLNKIVNEFGITIDLFNIEAIDVPKEDYDEITKAKSISTSRKLQGFTWQEEQMYQILDDAARNEGTSSQMMGAGMGLGMGVGMGAPLGRAFGDMTNNVFNTANGQSFVGGSNMSLDGNIPQPTRPSTSNGNENIDVNNFFNHQLNSSSPTDVKRNQKYCSVCGNASLLDAMFCSACGNKFPSSNNCPNCGNVVEPTAMFCSKCGNKLK